MGSCQTCKAPIMWRRTDKGRANPLDPEPAPNGNVLLVGVKECRVLGGDELAATRADGVPLYLSHFSTCPDADRFRTKKGDRRA